MRSIVHVDLDAFYASVEQLDDPSLKGRPVLVGGRSRRSVVAAASYEARVFGAKSAMPMGEALRRCPNAAVVPPRMARYAEMSDRIFAIFGRYTPLVEGLSLDEAFLDLTGTEALFGDAITVARRIRAEIREETGLTASAGVAPCKLVAKIASDLDKPDGLVVVAAEGMEAFLSPLPIERMWGIGPKAAARLHEVGFSTFEDLATADPLLLERLLGSWGLEVHRLARGDDPRPVIPDRDAKSLGAEETYEHDLREDEELHPELLRLAARVAARLSRAGLRGRVVTLKTKYPNHQVRTRQMRLEEAIADTDSLYETALKLLAKVPERSRGFRLTGISVSELVPHDARAGLFEDERRVRREKLESVTQSLRERFGDKGLTRGTLVRKDGEPEGPKDVAPKVRR
ncbi:MAG: DNA polymerase IV [Sandaracinus sp.]|nr:DNA polymerase IV [Sandaracinus sp.]MCB9631048.1 DNA polymerase IV [Sandaracinus sp.]